MSKLFIEDTTLTAIGNAIRTKEGTTEPIPTVDMAERIANLPSGGISAVISPTFFEFANFNIIEE